jgi:hypothetical protein
VSDRTDVVEQHLARLDRGALRAFVADLWAARGFETRVTDEVIVASRHGGSVAIFPTVAGRIRTPSPDRPVDVVVAPRGGEAATAVAADHGARLLVAADLHEMLRYAVEPTDADALCERHFGAPRSALRPTFRSRLRARATRVGAAADRSVDATTTLAVVALLVVAAGGVVAFGLSDPADRSVSGAGLAGGNATAAGSVDVVGADGPTAGSARDPGERATGAASPDAGSVVGTVTAPGVDSGGVTNLTALAVAHDRALGDRSYTLWLDVYRPENGVPSATRTQRDTDIAVEGNRYLVRESLEGDDGRRLVRVVYFDGVDWYVNDRVRADAPIRWINGTAADVPVRPDPRRLRETLVTRYLATPTTDVTARTEVGNTTRYRIEGEGRPSTLPASRITGYSVAAVVDGDGFVREATVEFTVVTVEGSYRLRFEWTYGRLGGTTVATPVWVEEARPAAVSTAPAATDNRTEAAS